MTLEQAKEGALALLASVGADLSPREAKVFLRWLELEARTQRLLGDQPPAPVPKGTPSFKCPSCRRVSHNPTDARERYCGACCTWFP